MAQSSAAGIGRARSGCSLADPVSVTTCRRADPPKARSESDANEVVRGNRQPFVVGREDVAGRNPLHRPVHETGCTIRSSVSHSVR